jgi:hypothetical protein
MPTILRVTEYDVLRRLNELGIKPRLPKVATDPFLKALMVGYSERINCTPDDPLFIPGTEAWRFAIRTLREELASLGWHRMDLGNYPLVVNDKTINIAVASGDEMTGLAHATPRTRSLKGVYTEAAIAKNRLTHGSFFPEMIPESVIKKVAALERPTWIFLLHITNDEIRGELSQPSSMTKREITSWSERIIFPKIEPGSRIEIGDVDNGPDIDVKVSRKA